MQYDLNSTVFKATLYLLNFRVKMFVRINMLVISRRISLSSILLLEIICPKYLKLLTYCSFSELAWNSGKQDITTLDRSYGEKNHTDWLPGIKWHVVYFHTAAQRYLTAVVIHAVRVLTELISSAMLVACVDTHATNIATNPRSIHLCQHIPHIACKKTMVTILHLALCHYLE